LQFRTGGNRRVDTFQAIVVRDRNIRNAMADHGQMPDLAMIVKVEKAFFHCGKCITRSKLWNSRL
jgi:uncharacterized protein